MTFEQLEKMVLEHLADSIAIQKSLADNKNDLKWVKRAVFAVAASNIILCMLVGILLRVAFAWVR